MPYKFESVSNKTVLCPVCGKRVFMIGTNGKEARYTHALTVSMSDLMNGTTKAPRPCVKKLSNISKDHAVASKENNRPLESKVIDPVK